MRWLLLLVVMFECQDDVCLSCWQRHHHPIDKVCELIPLVEA